MPGYKIPFPFTEVELKNPIWPIPWPKD
jgi:hypothetical protein